MGPGQAVIPSTPLLIGGADLEDSAATLVAYASPQGPREVLHTTVTPEAEGKLLEALALTDEHKIPVVVDKEIQGRLPMDEDSQLYEQVVTVAKSVNHHLKAGDGIPEHTHANHAKLVAKLDELDANPKLTDPERAMLAHYRAATDALAARLQPGYDTPYTGGGKVGHIGAYEVASTVQVTEMVPAPAHAPPEGLLAARARKATRISPTLDDQGTVSWDGKQRSKANGHEYVVDLGDGYTAVYRPHDARGDKDDPDYSHRGALEIVAPPGAGHGPQLVDRLGQLNLVNRAMSPAEGEWSYLRRNIWAQGLANNPQVKDALEQARGLEDAVYFELVTERQHEAIGMNHQQLTRFGRQLLLESEARALTAKVGIVRDAVAEAHGLPDGDALRVAPGYDPTPKPAGGWLQWDRFDVAGNPGKVRQAFGKRGLVHHTSASRILAMITNGGVLACTERRRLMGVPAGSGMSETADMKTGGAQSVFLRVASPLNKGPALVWDDPTGLLQRADWYAYPGDHYGAINPIAHNYSASKLTRDPTAVGGFTSGSNEVMFRNGIDLTGPQAPSRILCGSATVRDQVLKVLNTRGVTHIGGRPADQVVRP